MAAILPLVKKYDAAVIALPNDHDEIPMEADKRLELTEKIIRVATTEYGIAAADIVIDPLAMPIGADTSVVRTTLETIAPDPRRVRREHDPAAPPTSPSACPTGTPSARRSCRWR